MNKAMLGTLIALFIGIIIVMALLSPITTNVGEMTDLGNQSNE